MGTYAAPDHLGKRPSHREMLPEREVNNAKPILSEQRPVHVSDGFEGVFVGTLNRRINLKPLPRYKSVLGS